MWSVEWWLEENAKVAIPSQNGGLNDRYPLSTGNTLETMETG